MTASQLLLLGGASAPAVDPYFYSVTSLLHGDGTNGAQNNTFLDSSTNNFTITRNGNTTQGSYSPFSQTGWGYFFPNAPSGTSSVSFPDSTGFAFGSGDFTVEAWIFVTASRTGTVPGVGIDIGVIYAQCANLANNSNRSHALQFLNDRLRFYWTTNGVTDQSVDFLGNIPQNQWTHVAVCRSGNTLYGFLNGVLLGTSSFTANIFDSSAPLYVGTFGSYPISDGYVGLTFPGYISNLRITKGGGLYTASFTPSTTPLTTTVSAGTVALLTAQSNRFIDNSATASVGSVTTSPSVQPFSPFNPLTPYSTSAVGGSGYFDGSGDYLTFTPSSAIVCPADFTLEMWLLLDLASDNYVAGQYGNRSVNGDWLIYINTSGGGTIFLAGDQASPRISLASGTIKRGQWNHFALVRSGSTVTCYVNGVSAGTATKATDFGVTDISYQIGSYYTSTLFCKGYIAGYRLVKGTAVYTGTFTPPTSPPTAISGTSLLLNFTNAGIFDNAADADYETVGNAQISTSVKKYGTGSMYFDGTGDYLTSPYNPWMRIVNADFTIEFWMQLGAAQADMGLVSSYENNNGWLVRLGSTFVRFFAGSSQIVVDNNFSFSTGVWYHVAVVRCANVLKMFVNGTQIGANATVTTATDTTTAGLQVGRTHTVTNDFNGYIDDLRISKGVARYPYNFTPPTAEFPNIGGTVTLTADPYYDYTTLLLPGNGTNGAQNNTFLDSSTNNFTITRNGNTTQGTFSPFSQTGWGNFFDGTGDYLTVADNTALQMGSGDFTIEYWWYPISLSSYQNPIDKGYTQAGALLLQTGNGDGKIIVYANGGAVITASTAVTANAWNHMALVRNGTSLVLYLNGTSVGAATNSTNFNNAAALGIGATATAPGGGSIGAWPIVGYLSNVRFVKGTAVYTANFTPPTTPLTAISGTSLLTCQSNRFRDASTNNFAITAVGNTSVQAFSPFNPTAAWSAATNGGSGYFDGSGDYLNGPSTGQFAPTGDFTISMWIYPTSFAASFYVLAGSWAGAGAANEWLIQYDNTGAIRFLTTTDSTFSAAGVIKLNQWQFLSISRTGSTLTGYVNGTSFRSYTLTGTVGSATKVVYIGAQQGTTWPYIGYMADFRMVAGSAESATPPTAPATAISGTNMLLNFTNAGIYDATSKNDLETVGNAQISTTQSKFGGSSMLFDGTGDWLRTPTSPNLDMGTGDLTIEGWFYLTATVAVDYRMIVSDATNGNNYVAIRGGGTGGQLEVNVNGTSFRLNLNNSVTINTWFHLAVTRYNGTWYGFVNGASLGSSASAAAFNLGNGGMFVGRFGGATAYEWPGYMDDLRITKGIARYTSNFTPPTTAFLTL